jgi:hypothetical protein
VFLRGLLGTNSETTTIYSTPGRAYVWARVLYAPTASRRQAISTRRGGRLSEMQSLPRALLLSMAMPDLVSDGDGDSAICGTRLGQFRVPVNNVQPSQLRSSTNSTRKG